MILGAFGGWVIERPTGMVAVWVDTLAALAAPRRAVPTLVVAVPLIAAQAYFSRMSSSATGLAVVMVAVFLGVAPPAWRWLFPPDQAAGADYPLRLLLYAALGSLPAALAFGAPILLDFEDSFLGAGVNTLVAAALFWVGGWGLARDVEQEQGLIRAQARAEASAREAEHAQLLAMRNHLDPHFLFNTLNALAEWTREDPEVAERGILRLSSLLREVLGAIRTERWPLDRELALARDVWELHLLRDPGWFTIRWSVAEDAPKHALPSLLLLPLFENAVKHGPARGFRGELSLDVQVEGGELVITVENPGPWNGPRAGSDGLPTVEKRLASIYAGRARIEAGPAGERARVRLRLPL